MTKRNPFAHLSPGYVAEAPDAAADAPEVEPLPCPMCDGDGDTPSGGDCPRCDGEGEVPAVACAQCDGEGEVSGTTCAACLGEGRTYEDGKPYEGKEDAAAFGAAAAAVMAKARPGFVADASTGMIRKARLAAANKALGVRPRKASRPSAEVDTFAAQMKAALKKMGR